MFRILFGALMFWQATYYLFNGRYIRYYLQPSFHFTYDFFQFVHPLPAPYLSWVFVFMAAAAIGIMLGLFYRWSVLAFLLSYTYVFLLDKAYYNNHYYFIILLSFLMLWVDAQRWASLDQALRPKTPAAPFWNLFILRAQVFLVYFFGGIAKLNGDWLQGEPMRHWLRHGMHPAWADALLRLSWMPYFFSWGGVLFDLSIGFFLLWKRTRFYAFLVILFFNLTNSFLFNIGVFPFLMIASATLFDDPDWPRKFWGKATPPLPGLSTSRGRQATILALLGFYFSLQALIPLRHWLYPGKVSWTEEGHFFSWHMKLRDKKGDLEIQVMNPQTGETRSVRLEDELNKFQIGKLIQRPQFIYQYVQHLKEKAQREGIEHPDIRVLSRVSLNGRPPQLMIDPKVNLAEAPWSVFGHSDWIIPLDPYSKPGTWNKGRDKDNEREIDPEEAN